MLSIVALIFVGTFAVCCSSEDGERELHVCEFFSTTDIHADFETYRSDATLPQLLRALVDSRRASRVPNLWIDVGDLFYGPAEGNVYGGDFTAQMVRLGGGDILIPGNHDFDGRGIAPASLMRISGFKHMVSANLCASFIDSYVIYDFSGVRIGITGLSPMPSHGLDSWGTCRDEIEALREVMSVLKSEKVDCVVLGIHRGLYGGNPSLLTLLKTFPEIDLVFLGHSHEVVSGTCPMRRTYAVQAPSHARGFVRVALSRLPMTNRSVRCPFQLTSEIVSPDSRPLWGDLCPEFERRESFLNRMYAEGFSENPNTFLEQTLCGICGAQNDAFLAHRLISDSLQKLTVRDVYQAYPYNNELYVFSASRDSFIAYTKGIKMSAKQRRFYLRGWKKNETRKILIDDYTLYGRDGRTENFSKRFRTENVSLEKMSKPIHSLLFDDFGLKTLKK